MPGAHRELGSITKVFTALLLAIAVERGEVGLDDPVAKHLPPGTKVPSLNGRSITLRDLATHTSGLPRVPNNLPSEASDDPYAGYTVEMLYAYLATLELERDPGRKYAYSNLGAALLAHAVSVRTGSPTPSWCKSASASRSACAIPGSTCPPNGGRSSRSGTRRCCSQRRIALVMR